MVHLQHTIKSYYVEYADTPYEVLLDGDETIVLTDMGDKVEDDNLILNYFYENLNAE